MEGKNIKIKKFSEKDKKRVKDFLDFNNSVAEEKLMLVENKKRTPEEEEKRLERRMEAINNKKEIFLFAEDKGRVAGTVKVKLNTGAKKHVADIFGFVIRKEYRRMGLGKKLIKEVIIVAEKELKSRPKILRLSVFAENEPAIKLYEKFGFKIVSGIPKQFRYKKKLVDELIMIKII